MSHIASRPPGYEYPARFPVKTALVGHVHLNMLAEDDVESRCGERQVGDVCLANGDPVVQSDKPIEPTGRFAVLLGEIDGGNPAMTPVCDEARSAADPGARVEHFGLIL